MSIHDGLNRILTEWPKEKQRPFADNPLAQFIRTDFAHEIATVVHQINPDLKVKGSAGQGNWADVPWIAILNPRITTSIEEGVYPVFLFRADATGVYISLGQGTTEPIERLGRNEAETFLIERAGKLRDQFPKLASWIAGPTNLQARTQRGKSYETANIGAKLYETDKLPLEKALLDDLQELLQIYEQIAKTWPLTTPSEIATAARFSTDIFFTHSKSLMSLYQ